MVFVALLSYQDIFLNKTRWLMFLSKFLSFFGFTAYYKNFQVKFTFIHIWSNSKCDFTLKVSENKTKNKVTVDYVLATMKLGNFNLIFQIGKFHFKIT